MKLLAIETSCDETAIAIVEIRHKQHKNTITVLSHIISSQAPIHAVWGGVVPHIAKREHQKMLVPLLTHALRESGHRIPKKKITLSEVLQKDLDAILEREPELAKHLHDTPGLFHVPDIDAVVVTNGPGLEPALWVGVNFARALSKLWGKPLFGINHMEGHIAIAFMRENIQKKNMPLKQKKRHQYTISTITYPALALLVSGGHTELVLMQKKGVFRIIGETRDDAAGEAFDKAARILGLGYPGGPAISLEAKKSVSPTAIQRPILLPRPMMQSRDLDFSFSGLKTALLYLVRDLEKHQVRVRRIRPAIAKEFQHAVVDVLVAKTLRAMHTYNVRTCILGGGVAANAELRDRLSHKIQEQFPRTTCYMPPISFTGDNGLMIAAAAYMRMQRVSSRKTKEAMHAWKTLRPDATMRLS